MQIILRSGENHIHLWKTPEEEENSQSKWSIVDERQVESIDKRVNYLEPDVEIAIRE